MKSAKPLVIIISILLIPMLIFSISCAQKEQGLGEEGEHAPGEAAEHASREAGEHAGGEEGEESHGEEGEESGIRYTLSETCEEVRKGVQLHLTFDQSSSTFIGTINNISNETAKRVRVEVHLSNEVELGPTEPVDLAPGKQVNVKLSAEGQSFTWWTAHAESGGSEH
ncbi:hypothetical protein ACFL5L_01280 [candidate division KSB1 bacterium]